MINIPLKVNGSLLYQDEIVKIASGASNSIQVTFTIPQTSDFNDPTLTKKAIFRYYQGSYFISDVDSNNQVIVPKFVIASPYFKVALRAENNDKTVVITTNEIQIPVDASPTLYDSTIVDGDVTIRNGDNTLHIYKVGDVTYIDFAQAYKTAVDGVINGNYAATSRVALIENSVAGIQSTLINVDSRLIALETAVGNINTDIGGLDERLDAVEENKADVDGNYPTLTSGLSLLTKNVEAKTKIENNEPYIVRATPSGVAEDCLLNAVVGVDVVKNQLVLNSDFSTNSSWTPSAENITISGGEAVITLNNASEGSKITQGTRKYVSGHQYLMYCIAKSSDVNLVFNMFYDGSSKYQGLDLTSSYKSYSLIVTASNTTSDGQIQICRLNSNNVTGTVYYKQMCVIDLTQRYGNNDVVNAIIGSDTTTQVVRLLAFDPDILKNTEYDTGTLQNTKVSGRKVTNANAWDEEWELGGLSTSTGAVYGTSNSIISSNFIKVFNEQTYYCKAPNNVYLFMYDANQNFIDYIPTNKQNQTFDFSGNGGNGNPLSNATYIKFRCDVTTYNHDITINISNPLINGTYISHKENTYPIEPIDLHGVFKVENGKVVADGDYYRHDGQGKRKFEIVDLEMLSWTAGQYGSNNGWYTDNVTNIKQIAYGYKPSAISSKYAIVNSISTNLIVDTLTLQYNSTRLWVGRESGNTTNKPTGYLIYELATETDFEATPFTQIQKSYLDGTEEWLSPTNHINPPVPHETSYLPDLADKLELSPNNPNADGTYVVQRANGVNSYTPLNTWLTNNDYRQAKDLPTIEALGGTLRQLLCVAKSLLFENTDYVEMNSLNWSYFGSGIFVATLAGANKIANNGNIISTKYITVGSATSMSNGNNCIGLNLSGYSTTYPTIYAKIGTSDINIFNQNIKGVLLAYEKA